MSWEQAHPVSRRRLSRAFLAPLVLVFAVNCTVVHRVNISPVPPGVPATIATPVRAHLTDGSTVIFAEGVSMTADAIEGRGTRYDLWRTTGVRVQRVERAEVLGMETFREQVDGGASFLLSALGVGVVVGVLALILATDWNYGFTLPNRYDDAEWAPAGTFEGRPGSWVPVH